MDVGRVIQAAKRAIGDLVDADALDGLFARRDIIVEAFEKLAEEEGTNQVFPPLTAYHSKTRRGSVSDMAIMRWSAA